jgi:Putative prokaryotic signal transducing protein
LQEILRTNDPVRISYASALLKDAGIVFEVFDAHTSNLEGSVLAIQRRLVVLDEDVEEARHILMDAGLDPVNG